MKKLQNLLMLSAVAALASCSDNDAAPNAPSADELVTVTISADLNLDTQSRAVSSTQDDEITRCLLQIIDTEGEDNPTVTLTGDQTNGFSGSVTLYKHKTYSLLFWADQGTSDTDDSYYVTHDNNNALDLTAVSVATDKEVSIAYALKDTYTYSESNPAISATLTHAVAKISILTTTALAANQELTVGGVKTASTYNVETKTYGAASAKERTATTAAVTADDITAVTDKRVDVFSFYALTSDETCTVTIQCGMSEEIEVSNVPVKTNNHTILYGDIQGQSATAIKVSMNTNWTDGGTHEAKPADNTQQGN